MELGGLEARKAGIRESRARPEGRPTSSKGGQAGLDDGSASPEEREYSSEEDLRRLDSELISVIGECLLTFGAPLDGFVRSYLTTALRRDGEIPEGAELVEGFIDGEEVDIFLEDPLIVGEVTSYASSVDEMMKLLKKAELAKARYSREPKKILVVLKAKRDAARELRRIAEEKGVKLIIGKVVD
jgi:hypothetical protein